MRRENFPDNLNRALSEPDQYEDDFDEWDHEEGEIDSDDLGSLWSTGEGPAYLDEIAEEDEDYENNLNDQLNNLNLTQETDVSWEEFIQRDMQDEAANALPEACIPYDTGIDPEILRNIAIAEQDENRSTRRQLRMNRMNFELEGLFEDPHRGWEMEQEMDDLETELYYQDQRLTALINHYNAQREEMGNWTDDENGEGDVIMWNDEEDNWSEEGASGDDDWSDEDDRSGFYVRRGT